MNDIGSLLEIPRYTESYAHLSDNRIIFISEDISKDVASSMSALLLYYDQESEVDDISIYINTNGGDANALINIYDVMSLVRAPIKTICIGKAYSAGSFILAAGTKGKRFITKNASVMIHGLQTTFPSGDMVKSDIHMKHLHDCNNAILGLMAKHTGKSLKTIVNDCKQDMFMDAMATLEYGIVDKII